MNGKHEIDLNRPSGYIDRDVELSLTFADLAREKPDPRLKRHLLSPGEARRRIALGGDAVRLSIEKWARIRDFMMSRDSETEFLRLGANPVRYFLADSCALCIVSAKTMQYKHGVSLQELEHRKCEVCPLAKVDCCREPGSAYQRIMGQSIADREKLTLAIDDILAALNESRKFGKFRRDALRGSLQFLARLPGKTFQDVRHGMIAWFQEIARILKV